MEDRDSSGDGNNQIAAGASRFTRRSGARSENADARDPFDDEKDQGLSRKSHSSKRDGMLKFDK